MLTEHNQKMKLKTYFILKLEIKSLKNAQKRYHLYIIAECNFQKQILLFTLFSKVK
jgi:hypothetical protein